MKYIVVFSLGFLFKLSLYEASNLSYNIIYSGYIKTEECQKHERSPHICASDLTEQNNIAVLFNKLDTNLGIWECEYPFTTDKPFICRFL